MNKADSLYKAVITISHTTALLGDPYIVLYIKRQKNDGRLRIVVLSKT